LQSVKHRSAEHSAGDMPRRCCYGGGDGGGDGGGGGGGGSGGGAARVAYLTKLGLQLLHILRLFVAKLTYATWTAS
jgi:hypothetical protein